MVRIAIACETPFHLLNAINYAYNQLPENATIDLYVLEGKVISDSMINRIKNTKIFNSVKVYNYLKNDLSYDKKYILIDKISRVLFLKSYIKRRLKNENMMYDYDYIFVSIVTKFIFGLISLNKRAKVIYFDDGLGTYIDNYDYNLFRRSSKIYRIIGRNTNYLNPVKLYVNNLKFCKKTITDNIEEFYPLKDADKSFWDDVEYIFGIKDNDLYQEKKVVYLSMPNDFNLIGFDEIVKDTLNALCESNCIIRPHPRDGFSFPRTFAIDNSNAMWEIVSAKYITDQHVLIGAFSTAQMTPKMIYDKEPKLIFVYKLYKDAFTKEQVKKIEGLIDILKSTYEEKNKIHIVDDLTGLKELMDELKETNNG